MIWFKVKYSFRGKVCYLWWDNACQLKWMRPSFVGVFGAGEENYGDDLMERVRAC